MVGFKCFWCKHESDNGSRWFFTCVTLYSKSVVCDWKREVSLKCVSEYSEPTFSVTLHDDPRNIVFFIFI